MVDEASIRHTSPLVTRNWVDSTQKRIDAQAALVAAIKPGTDAHRSAIEVLLLLRDSLHALIEARELVAQCQAANGAT